MRAESRWTAIGVLAALVVGVVLTAWITPRIGAVQHEADEHEHVLHSIRMPRLQLGMAAGAGLALAGMVFQAIFRNPLAEPFTLGVSSGASLAITIGLACGLRAGWLGGTGQMMAAFAGALGVVLIVYGFARLRPESPTAMLLLAGVSINFICGAGIILVQYFLQEHESKAVIHWLIGSIKAIGQDRFELWGVEWYYNREALLVSVILVVGLTILAILHRDLDLLMMGEQMAASRGVEVRRARGLAYFCASLMTAVVVSVCGPIAFVGLLVPHTMRALVGPTHRRLLPACLLFGMSLLPVCDCVARNLLAWTSENNSAELPVGVVTNVLGGIFFVTILIRQRADRPILA